MITTRTLTGRTRFREEKKFFRPSLLVLQVEERVRGNSDAMGNEMPAFEYLEFRDISITDLKSPLEVAQFQTEPFPALQQQQ